MAWYEPVEKRECARKCGRKIKAGNKSGLCWCCGRDVWTKAQRGKTRQRRSGNGEAGR